MKKDKTKIDELLPEYRREDFGKMVRGKYAKQYKEASNVAVIAHEVQKAFPNTQVVNDALRGLLELAQASGLTPRATRKTTSPRRAEKQRAFRRMRIYSIGNSFARNTNLK